MRKLLILSLFFLCPLAFPQGVTINAGTMIGSRQDAFSPDSSRTMLWVDGVRYTTIAAAYTACPPTGGVVHVPPGYVERPFTAINARANCGIVFDGTATLVSANTFFTNTTSVPGFFLIGPAANPLSIANGDLASPVRLVYGGSGTAVNLAGNGTQTFGLELDNIMVDITDAGPSAVCWKVVFTSPISSKNLTCQGVNNGTNTQTGLVLDGTGGFTSGEFYNVYLGGVKTCVLFTGQGYSTANDNVITGTCNARGKAARGLDFEGGNGNRIGMNIENATTAIFMGDLASNANNLITIYNCGETTFANIAGPQAANNRIEATGGCSVVGKVTDKGTGDSIYNVAQTFRSDPNGNIIFTGWMRGAAASESSPTYSWSSDTDTGLYNEAGGVIGFSSHSNGTQLTLGMGVARFKSSQVVSFSSGDPKIQTGDTAICRMGSGVVGVANNETCAATGELRSSRIAATYNAAGTLQTAVHIVEDICTLGTNCTVAFGGPAAFTSASSYSCSCADQTGANACGAKQISGSEVIFTGNGTDLLRYICVGN